MRVGWRSESRRGRRRRERLPGEHAFGVGENGGGEFGDALGEEDDGAAVLVVVVRGGAGGRGRGLVGVVAGIVYGMKPGVESGAVRARREEQDNGDAERRQQELQSQGEVAW